MGYIVALSESEIKKMEVAAAAEARICVDPVKTQLRWYDTMVGISQKGGQLPAVATKYGLVSLIGIEFVPEGTLRVPRKHDYRLMGVIRSGATVRNYDEFGMFLYELARLLGAQPGEVIEMTNTVLTEYGLHVLDPGFVLPKAAAMTLSWPYRETGSSVTKPLPVAG